MKPASTLPRFLLPLLLCLVTVTVGGDDTPATASSIRVNGSANGAISPAGDVDYWRFNVPSAGQLVVETAGDTDTIGALEDSAGNLLQEHDDQDVNTNRNFKIERAVTAGVYYIRISAYRNSTGDYTLHVRHTPESSGGTGDGGAAPSGTYVAVSHALGDLNGDGRDDVLLRHTDGRWHYYPMNGPEFLASQRGAAALTSNPDWQFAALGDLNGDGRDDVLLRRVTDGRWYYYPMNGRRHLADQRGGANIISDLNWRLAGTGDLNGDGRDDVLLRHTDGRWLYYPMNGREYIAGRRATANLTRDLSWGVVTGTTATQGNQGGDNDDGDTGTGAPDLVVESPSVSDSTPTPGDAFSFNLRVRNRGDARSGSTTLRYYRSTNSTVNSSDTQVGTDSVAGLSGGGNISVSETLVAPSSPGTYYYGACVDAVGGESDTGNNCSGGVRVTVDSGDTGGGGGNGSGDDHGNTRSGATVLPTNVSRAGRIDPGDDTDYFSVRLSESGALGVGTSGNLDTRGELQSSSGAALGNDDDGGDGNNFRIERQVDAGTYYVKVESYRTNTGGYTVHIEFNSAGSGGDNSNGGNADDHGNTRSGATALVLPTNVSRAGRIDPGDDTDYFSVRLSESGALGVGTSGNLDTRGELQSSSGAALGNDDDGGDGNNFRIERQVDAGTYYVKVESYRTNTGDYTLHAYFEGDGDGDGPDLVVEAPSVSASTLSPGESFTLRATVRNRGTARSDSTRLRYFRSSNYSIHGSETEVGTDPVDALAASATSAESIRLDAPYAAIWYYGACVVSVNGETNTRNNCSDEVRVTVGDHGGGGGTGGDGGTGGRGGAAIPPVMVSIPGGTFRMGDLHGVGNSNELPVHSVTVGPFRLGKYEVTFAQWDACVADGGCGGYQPDDSGWGRGNRPVFDVSWTDAQSFINWLNGKTGGGYRLPTEAEWEYAARAGSTTQFSWGNSIGSNRANCWQPECGDDYKYTAPVGSFPANAWGLHNMHGNVLEWVQDCRNDSSYEGAPTDGSAWESGRCTWRVIRGGSWSDNPWSLRSANRNWGLQTFRNDGRNEHGFRLAQDE